MLKDQTRRNFLRTAPIAAASLTLAHSLMASAETREGEGGGVPPAVPFQVFTAETLKADAKALEAAPGNNNLVTSKELNFAIVMTVEKAKSAKEFEWHEGRDHIIQVIDGETVYEVGGSPVNGRSTKPGEWLAPSSEGATKLTLKKGDMLTIPRGTPHKRSTAGSVTFYLISPSGMMM